jgi:hypothetical protein
MEPNFSDARRDVLRKAVFVTPLILTLPVLPSFAKAGSNAGEETDDTGVAGSAQSGRHRRRHHSNFWSIFGL